MNVGKWAIALFLICLLAYSMLAIFSVLKNDQSPDAIYKVANSTVNQSVNLTETVTATGTGMITPLTLVVAVLFFLAIILIFERRW
jgi:ABC-type Na+ efflux pump permease subunit